MTVCEVGQTHASIAELEITLARNMHKQLSELVDASMAEADANMKRIMGAADALQVILGSNQPESPRGGHLYWTGVRGEGGGQGSIRLAVHSRRRGGSPPPDQSDHCGNEIYN